MRTSVGSVEESEVGGFIDAVGYPVMVKAVDGGGGRGVRLVSGPGELGSGIRRACGESGSGRVFLEKAAVDGFRHVEVQVLGDGRGRVWHLGERECSIQRRLVGFNLLFCFPLLILQLLRIAGFRKWWRLLLRRLRTSV